jgi:uncharacterized protein (DUF1684 family)
MPLRLTYLSFLASALLIVAASCSSTGEHDESKQLSAYAKKFYINRAAKDEEMLKDKIIEAGKTKDFKGLQYFEPDSSYRVMASMKWLNRDSVIFRTNSERSPVYFRLFELSFKLADSMQRLTVYSEDRDGKTGLFIPFRDKTNNRETYGGGRYIEIPYKGETETFELDFNLAFNPYCHYNHSYSCPLVPYENNLNIPIHAGEKKLYE